MKQVITSIIIFPILYFALSGMFIVNMSPKTSKQSNILTQQSYSGLQNLYLASHNSLIITSNQGISHLSNSLTMYEKIYITQNVTEIEDSIVRTRGILLLNSLEELIDFSKMSRSQVDKYELVTFNQESYIAEDIQGHHLVQGDNTENQINQQQKESTEPILQINPQHRAESINSQLKHQRQIEMVPQLIKQQYPFLETLIDPQYLSSMLAHQPHHDKLLYLPMFISQLLQIDCYQYDGLTLLDKRYPIDIANFTQLFDWLDKQTKMRKEEKCGIRLDNRLVINVMKRQNQLRDIVYGKYYLQQEQINHGSIQTEQALLDEVSTQHQPQESYHEENIIQSSQSTQQQRKNQELPDDQEDHLQLNQEQQYHQTSNEGQYQQPRHQEQYQQTNNKENYQNQNNQQQQQRTNNQEQLQQSNNEQQYHQPNIQEQSQTYSDKQFQNQDVVTHQHQHFNDNAIEHQFADVQNQTQNYKLDQQSQAESSINEERQIESVQNDLADKSSDQLIDDKEYNQVETKGTDDQIQQVNQNQQILAKQQTSSEQPISNQSINTQTVQESNTQNKVEQQDEEQHNQIELINEKTNQHVPQEILAMNLQSPSSQQQSHPNIHIEVHGTDYNQELRDEDKQNQIVQGVNHVQTQNLYPSNQQSNPSSSYTENSQSIDTHQQTQFIESAPVEDQVQMSDQPINEELALSDNKVPVVQQFEEFLPVYNQENIERKNQDQSNPVEQTMADHQKQPEQEQIQQQPLTQNDTQNNSPTQFSEQIPQHFSNIDQLDQNAFAENQKSKSVQQTETLDIEIEFSQEPLVDNNYQGSLVSHESATNSQQELDHFHEQQQQQQAEETLPSSEQSSYPQQSRERSQIQQQPSSLKHQQSQSQQSQQSPVQMQQSTTQITQPYQNLQEEHYYPKNPAFETPLTDSGFSTQHQQQQMPLVEPQPQTLLQFSPSQATIENELLPERQHSQQTLLEHTFKHERQYPLPRQPSYHQSDVVQNSRQHSETEIIDGGIQYSEVYQPDEYKKVIDLADFMFRQEDLMVKSQGFESELQVADQGQF